MRPETELVEIGVDGAVGSLRIARPAKLNALSRQVLDELAEGARWFDTREDVKVVVISGQGGAFSAGFDLAEPVGAGPPDHGGGAASGRDMAESIGSMTAVTIASLRGHCIGGGVVLAAACDMRVASESTVFRIPEIDLGIPLYWTGTPRLVRELGPSITKELIMTGRAFDAREAAGWHFVNRVVRDDLLEEETSALAVQLAAKPRLALTVTKTQVDEASPQLPDSDGGVESDAAGFAAAFDDPESREVAARYIAEIAGRSRS